jgi:LysM repeat protein
MRKQAVLATLLVMLVGCRLEVQEESAREENATDQTTLPAESKPSIKTDSEGLPIVSPQAVLGNVPTSRQDQYHHVKEGETLGQIAKRYGTTAETLTQVNGLGAPDKLQPGQRIYIPQSEKPPKESK